MYTDLDQDLSLTSDENLLDMVWNNLLSNAFKFTGTGDAICVSVTQLDSGEYAKYKFVVSDTGNWNVSGLSAASV